MALTPRAEAGLAHAAAIAGQTVAQFKEATLERLGLEWADHADTALKEKRIDAFDKADVKATKEQILAAATSTAVIKG